MKETHTGTIISVAVHTCIIPILMAASITMGNRPVSLVEVDLSLVKEQPRAYPAPTEEKKLKAEKPQKIERVPRRAIEPDLSAGPDPQPVPLKEQVAPVPAPTIVTASDVQGETVIHGTPASYAGSSGGENHLQSHGGSGDGTESSDQGKGRGGEIMAEGSRDYNYIRDAVLKNIKYPERARRMGFEGKALLSFVLLENGATSEIKVIRSSGYKLLDDSAKEGIARTVIPRKVSYRVVVRLPITFTLRVSKGDGT